MGGTSILDLHPIFDVLILLDSCTDGGNGIGDDHRCELANTTTDEILLLELGLRDAHFVIDQFRSLVYVHLEHPTEGK